MKLLVGWLNPMNNFSFASGATVSAAWQRHMHDLLQMSIIAISYLVVSNWWRGKHSINHCNVQHGGFLLKDKQFFLGQATSSKYSPSICDKAACNIDTYKNGRNLKILVKICLCVRSNSCKSIARDHLFIHPTSEFLNSQVNLILSSYCLNIV